MHRFKTRKHVNVGVRSLLVSLIMLCTGWKHIFSKALWVTIHLQSYWRPLSTVCFAVKSGIVGLVKTGLTVLTELIITHYHYLRVQMTIIHSKPLKHHDRLLETKLPIDQLFSSFWPHGSGSLFGKIWTLLVCSLSIDYGILMVVLVRNSHSRCLFS